ncbi:MAG: 30S ribosomal protein S3 [Candidatus Woesearchaeota archaeon]
MERDFIAQKTKELQIKNYLESKLSNVGLSKIKLKKIPLGEKIIIYTSRPSLIVGSRGANIKDLTRYLKKEFKLENPQIEISEIKEIFLDANVVAERIVSSLERFGSARFKGVGHKTVENVIRAGALGVEIIIAGKIPGARAKSWRFYQGYLKKCGDISITGVRKSNKSAVLKSGMIGVKVSIMPPDIKLPDRIEILKEPTEIVIEEVTKETEKKKPKRKTAAKKAKQETKPEVKQETPTEEEKQPEIKEEEKSKEKEPVVEEKMAEVPEEEQISEKQ